MRGPPRLWERTAQKSVGVRGKLRHEPSSRFETDRAQSGGHSGEKHVGLNGTLQHPDWQAEAHHAAKRRLHRRTDAPGGGGLLRNAQEPA